MSHSFVEALRTIGQRPAVDPKAWARALRNRHMAGERLTITQVAMYRAALAQDERRAAAMSAQTIDLPPVAPPRPPAVELPPLDAYHGDEA